MRKLYLAASIGALIVAQSAHAQTASSQSGYSGLQEVVVTARKRSENIQNVPISIAALSPTQLQQNATRTIVDLTAITPGLMVQQGQTTNAANSQVNIRGYVQRDDLIGFDQPTTIYVDNVFAEGLAGTIGTSLYDIDRLEVLKGPQGTLFGRNSIGGALQVFTKAPTNSFEGEILAGAANHGGARAAGFLNVPLNDKAAFRITGEYNKVGDWAKNAATGGRTGGMTTYVIRGALKLNPTDKLQIVARAGYNKINASGIPMHLLRWVPGGPAFLEAYSEEGGSLPALFGGTVDPVIAARAAANLDMMVNAPKNVTYAAQEGGQTVKTYTGSAEISYDLSDSVSLKSISGFRHLVSTSASDFDGTIYKLGNAPQHRNLTEMTQELQLNAKMFDDRLNLVAGAYYYHFKGHELQGSRVFENLFALVRPLALTSTQNPHVKRNSPALYAQGTFALTPQINLTGGLRYTWDKQTSDARGTIYTDYALTNPTGCNVPFDTTVPCSYKLTTNHKSLTWLGSIDYKPVTDVMIYGKVARGFHTGGPQPRLNNDAATGAPYAPEYVTEFEGGFKSYLLDRRVKLNADFYYDKLTNGQFILTVLGSTGFTTLIQNAGRKDSYGFESELEFAPTEQVRVGGSLGWQKAKYKRVDFFNTATGQIVNVAGAYHPDNLPQWTYSLYGSYTQPTTVGPLTASLSWRWQSAAFLNTQLVKGPPSFPSNLLGIPGFAVGVPDDQQKEKAYGLLSGQLKLHVDAADLDLALWGKNLLNHKGYGTRTDLIRAGFGLNNARELQTRMFGVDVSKRF